MSLFRKDSYEEMLKKIRLSTFETKRKGEISYNFIRFLIVWTVSNGKAAHEKSTQMVQLQGTLEEEIIVVVR